MAEKRKFVSLSEANQEDSDNIRFSLRIPEYADANGIKMPEKIGVNFNGMRRLMHVVALESLPL